MVAILTPWIWEESNFKALEQGPYWRMPNGVLGGVDQRPHDAQVRRGGLPEGFALVNLDSSADIPSGSLVLDLNERATDSDRVDMAVRLGVDSADLDTPTTLDAIWRDMTELTDPTGMQHSKPLIPTRAGNLELHLGGLARREQFVWGIHPATAAIKALIESDFAEIKIADELKGKDHYKRILDAYAVKYNVDSSEIIPGQDTLPSATDIDDDFNRANESPLSGGGDWTAQDDTFDAILVSNAVKAGGASSATGVQTNAFASNDYTFQITLSTIGSVIAGALARHAASTVLSCYSSFFRTSGGQWEIWKRTAGTDAQLGSDLSSAGGTGGDTIRIEVDGTTLKVYKNGVQQGGDTTDATFSTGNGALRIFQETWIVDDATGSDLAAASAMINLAGYGGLASPGSYGMLAGKGGGLVG